MPDFSKIKSACNGMMRTECYERIYDAALGSPGMAFVEVGTGHGAGAVCLALALRDSGRQGTVYTIDRFEGGSRSRYGDAAQNMAIAEGAIASFGVASMIQFIQGDAAIVGKAVPETDIGMLLIDCDGRIDRDFASFYDRLVPGGAVVIDDVANRVRARKRGEMLRIDQKHRLSHLLVSSAKSHGLLVSSGRVGETWFGTKADARLSDWPAPAILDCYRRLVFADAPRC